MKDVYNVKRGRPSMKIGAKPGHSTSYYIAGCLDPTLPEKDVIFKMLDGDN